MAIKTFADKSSSSEHLRRS